jgi:hypothetical protein
MNYSNFFDRPVIPPWEVGMAVELRGTERASRLGRALQAASGQLGYPIDARRIDTIIRSLAGGTGGLLLDISDVGREDKPLSKVTASTTGMFTIPAAASARDVQKALDMAKLLGDTSQPVERLQATLRSLSRARDLVERNRRADEAVAQAKELLRFYEPHYDDILVFQKYRRELGRLEAEFELLKPEEKGQFLQRYQEALIKKKRLDEYWHAINALRQMHEYDDAARLLDDAIVAEGLDEEASTPTPARE